MVDPAILKRREYRKKRYWAKREYLRLQQRQLRERNKDHYLAKEKERRLKNGPQLRENHRRYRERNKDRLHAQQAAERRRVKVEVLNHYANGPARCSCCGEPRIEFLTIDHPDNNGSEERKRLGRQAGITFYRWLRQQGYPPGYGVLCYNCNCAKGFFGACPHKKTPGQL